MEHGVAVLRRGSAPIVHIYRDRKPSSSAAKSAGGNRSKRIVSPLRGWTNPSVAACSIARGTAILYPLKSRMYTFSPTSG